MPVRCWLIMFFVAQSMAMVNRNLSLAGFHNEFGCLVSDTTGEVSVEDLDEFHQPLWNSIVLQDFPKALPITLFILLCAQQLGSSFFTYLHKEGE